MLLAATLLVLLDLLAAFDTIDNKIPPACLSKWFGVEDLSLNWFQPYLADWTQVVKTGEKLSNDRSVDCGVPKGSVLHPLLFTTYTLPLRSMYSSFGIASHHPYADDTQVYVNITPDTADHAYQLQVTAKTV